MMDAKQERVLDLLTQLTPEKSHLKRVLRGDVLLGSPTESPSALLSPSEWPGGWCQGWTFALLPSMAPALDIQLTEKILKKKTYRAWTQGSAFAFQEGYVLHDVLLPPGEYPLWSDALQVINRTICVIKASPAVPATKENTRIRGLVTFFVLHTSEDRTHQVRGSTHSLTQDDFVGFLITGKIFSQYRLNANTTAP